MKRDLAAILGLLKRRPRCGGGDATKSPGGPDAAGAKRTKRPRAARLPLRKDSSGVGRRLRSRPYAVRSTGRFRRTRRRSLHVLMTAPQAVPPRSRRFWTWVAPAPVDRHVRREDLDRDGFVGSRPTTTC